MLNLGQIQKLLSLVDLRCCQESTIEGNPADIDLEFARGLKGIGFNRFSLGVQSFLDKELKTLTRRADKKQTLFAFECLRRAGFDNISCDLMYGLPRQTLSDLRISLQSLLELKPEHISTYLLTLEQGVSMYDQRKNLPRDSQLEKFYREIRKTLLAVGYQQYELSNFCLPGYASQHNLAYWQGKEYLALGEGGCSYYQKNQHYFRTDGFGNIEELTVQQRESEFIFLSLRMVQGLSLRDYSLKFGSSFLKRYKRILRKYEKFLLIDDQNVALLPKAYFVADEIMADFVSV